MSASVGSEGADPNLTPLLDLVLQLIMFFMITINFVRADQFDDAIKLPVATSAVALEPGSDDLVFLNLFADGKLAGTLSGAGLDTAEKIKVHLIRERENLERSARRAARPGRSRSSSSCARTSAASTQTCGRCSIRASVPGSSTGSCGP